MQEKRFCWYIVISAMFSKGKTCLGQRAAYSPINFCEMRSPLVFLRRSFSVLVDARRVGVLNLAGNSKGFTTKASTFLAAKSGISG